MYFVTFSIILFQAPYLRRTTQPARARLEHHPACGAEQDLERRTGVGQRLEEVGKAVGTRGWQSHGWQHGRSVSWGPEEQDKCPEMGTAAVVRGWGSSDCSGWELWMAETLLYWGRLGPRS